MTTRPRRLVLLGHPVAQSLSPVFQNAALRSVGVAIRYDALDVPPAALADTFRALRADGIAGNLTIPHKEAGVGQCDTLTPLARRAGAVNTFWLDDEAGLVGDNTDVGGFACLAARLLGGIPDGARVTVLGAGGAAAAVLTAVEGWPDATVTLAGRSAPRVHGLAARFPVVSATTGDPALAVRDAQVVINATPVGQFDDALPVPIGALAPGAAVMDLVCKGGETAWVRAARRHDLRASGGLPMLLEQGALAFERWLGIPAPRDVMWRSVREAA